jgi:hypothetical protein
MTLAEEFRAVAIHTRRKRKQQVLTRAADEYEQIVSGDPPKASPLFYERWRDAHLADVMTGKGQTRSSRERSNRSALRPIAVVKQPALLPRRGTSDHHRFHARQP